MKSFTWWAFRLHHSCFPPKKPGAMGYGGPGVYGVEVREAVKEREREGERERAREGERFDCSESTLAAETRRR